MIFSGMNERRAPSLIGENASYVKKVVFPLEVLPVAQIGAAAFHLMVSLSLVLVGNSQTRRLDGPSPRLYTPRGYLGDCGR